MRHAREDYNRIQDPENKIAADEPVFLLRGQDVVAPTVVRYWAKCAIKVGASPDITMAAFKQAKNMEDWQQKHGRKVPDMPKGA